MDLEYIEEQVDVWIESQIKENRLRSKINYEKILRKGNNTSINVRLDGNSNNTNEKSIRHNCRQD
tara:strand:+ start:658 stop:852 length:195 start_codon:yes stop_codon:yes gene_type:complete